MAHFISCPHCGAATPIDAACPRCGRPPKPERDWLELLGKVFPPTTIVSGSLLLAVVFVAAFVAAVVLSHPGLILVALGIGIVGIAIREANRRYISHR